MPGADDEGGAFLSWLPLDDAGDLRFLDFDLLFVNPSLLLTT